MVTAELVDRARRAFRLFERLEPEALQLLTSGLGEVRLPAGAMMFSPGDRCEGFGFVVDGSVTVGRVSKPGREIVLYRAQP